jgi:hypothetical protein
VRGKPRRLSPSIYAEKYVVNLVLNYAGNLAEKEKGSFSSVTHGNEEFTAMNTVRRAKIFALIISGIFTQQNITGELKQATRGARHLTMPIRLDDSLQLDKALKLAEPIALKSSVSYVQAYRQEGFLIYQFDLAQGYWESYTRQDVEGLTVGLSENKRPVEFAFDPPHALVAGTTGSGKSVTIASILFALMITHSPGELGVMIIDPDKELTSFNNAAHLEMPRAHEAEEIRKALLWADNELKQRRANDIKDGKTLVIAMDEAQQAKLLGDAKNLIIVQNLAQGRKYKIHLIVGTQKPTHTDLPKILDNLANRFVGLVTDAGIGSRLTGQPGLNCNKLTGKGDFIHVAGATVERLQVALVTPRDYETLERREVQPIEFEDTDISELPFEAVDKPIGRPSLTVDPKIAAQYFWRNPDKISISMARDLYNLSRDGHNLHKKFVYEFVTELRRLRQTPMIGV